MKSTLPRLFSVAAIIMAVASPLHAQETIEIKPRWEVGKKFSQTMRMDQDSTVTMGAQKIEQKVGMTMELTITVRAHENGKQKRVNVQYDHISMSMKMGPQAINYDSAAPGEDPLGMGKMMGAMIGKEIKIVMDEKGEVLDVENIEAMMKEMTAGNPMAASLGQMFGKDAMKNMMRQSSLYASPGKPVKAGDAWKFEYAMPLPSLGKVDMSGTYTLKGMADRAGVRCAEIGFDGKLGMDLSGDGAASGEGAAAFKQLGVTVEGGTVAGTLWFDPALGLSREAQFTQSMTMKMKNPQKPGEVIEIPMKQVITQTVTKVENL